MVEIFIDANSTHKAEELFEKYHKAFGTIVSVEMNNKLPKVEFELTLVNEAGDKMIVKNGLTSGYAGEGPHGTLRVLQKAGFDVDEKLVHTQDTFKLQK